MDEVEIPGYTAEINGYDIVNAYTGATPESPAPGGDDEPGSPDGPQTGDTSHIGLYFVLMLLSLAALIATVLLRKREAHKMKHRRLR